MVKFLKKRESKKQKTKEDAEYVAEIVWFTKAEFQRRFKGKIEADVEPSTS